MEMGQRLVALSLCFSVILTGAPPLAHAAPPDDKINEINSPYTLDQLKDFREKLRQQREKGAQEYNTVVDPSESVVTNFAAYVWKEPRARYLAAPIVLGETILAILLHRRLALNVLRWRGGIDTVADVKASMAPETKAFVQAQRDHLRALAASDAATRDAALKAAQEMDPRTKTMVEKTLKTGSQPPTGPTLPIERTTANLEKAYDALQKKAAVEARVLKAAGHPAPTVPQPLPQVAGSVDAATKAVTSLKYTHGEFFKFRNESLHHLAKQSKTNLGKALGWKSKVATGALLLAVPITVLGIDYYMARVAERERRLQDQNESALRDEGMWIDAMASYFNRPILYAMVKAWWQVKAKEKSPIAAFKFPYEPKIQQPPDGKKRRVFDRDTIRLMQAISMQTILDLDKEDVDVLVENEQRRVVISPEFFYRLFKKVLAAEASAVMRLDSSVLEPLLRDLATTSYHAFDEYDIADLPEIAADPAETPALDIDK